MRIGFWSKNLKELKGNLTQLLDVRAFVCYTTVKMDKHTPPAFAMLHYHPVSIVVFPARNSVSQEGNR